MTIPAAARADHPCAPRSVMAEKVITAVAP
jgi:hypothetical protein